MTHDLIIENALLVEPYASPRRGSIGISHGSIAEVGEDGAAMARGPQTRIIQANGLMALPGLINAHTHLFQTLLRGLGDELPGGAWFRGMMLPAAGALTPEDARIAAMVGCAESLLSGVTTVCDFMQVHGQPGMAEAVIAGMRQAGVRAVYARGISVTGEAAGMPPHLIESAEQALEHCADLQDAWSTSNDLVTVWVAPYAVWPMTELAARQIAKWADRRGSNLSVHVSASTDQIQDALDRFGMNDLVWLDEQGLLNERTQVVHAVYVDDDGIGRLARAGAAVAHCPGSNLYGGSGAAPVPAMRKAGVRVGIGTDGAASNNTQSLFEAMKLAVLIQKGFGSPGLGAAEALSLATDEGARSIGLGERIGRLAPGYRADVTLLDPRRLPMAPSHHPVSSVVYAGAPSCVHSVVVNGCVVVDDGRLQTLDLASLLEEAQERADALVRRAGLEHHCTRARTASL